VGLLWACEGRIESRSDGWEQGGREMPWERSAEAGESTWCSVSAAVGTAVGVGVQEFLMLVWGIGGDSGGRSVGTQCHFSGHSVGTQWALRLTAATAATAAPAAADAAAAATTTAAAAAAAIPADDERSADILHVDKAAQREVLLRALLARKGNAPTTPPSAHTTFLLLRK
jgi:hypothetical protein